MTALTGITVIELASEVGAFAGKLLGDMGADVILVEPPGGSPARGYPPFVDDRPGPENSLHWWHYQTSKRGITLDLEQSEGRDLFRRLAKGADIVIDAEPAGRLDALGIDFATLSADNPRLVHASITAFGRQSARRADPTTDLTVLAGAGPVWSCGYDDHSLPPIRGAGFQSHHISCHYAVMSILTALLHRHVSGSGQFIDVSQHAAANVTTEMASYYWLMSRSTVQRQTGRHAMDVATNPTQVQCADGTWVNTGVLPRTPQEFRGLRDWLDDLGLTEQLPEAVFIAMGAERERIDLSMIGRDDEVTAIFAAAREALTFIATKVGGFDYFLGSQRAGIPVGVVNAPEEAFEDPHFVARGFQHEVTHPDLDRTFRYPGAPYRFEKSPWKINRRAPLLGEHNDEILGGLATEANHDRTAGQED